MGFTFVGVGWGNGGGDERIGIKRRRHRIKADRSSQRRVGNRKVCTKISCGFLSTQLKAGQSLKTKVEV